MDWLNTSTGEIVDRRHPDFDFWAETFAHEDWVDASIEGTDPLPPLPIAPKKTEIPALALVVTREEAAELLRVSVQHFDRHVRPHLRELQPGRLVRYPVAELERYVNDNARRALS